MKSKNSEIAKILLLILSLILILLLLFSRNSFSLEKKLEIGFQILDDGFVIIKGFSPEELPYTTLEKGVVYGYTEELTEKKGKVWRFFYNLDKEYDYYVKVLLPEHSFLKKVESSSEYYVSLEKNMISIETKGKGNFSIQVEYEIKKERREKNLEIVYVTVGIILLISLIFLFYFFLYKKKQRKKKIEQKKENKIKKRKKEKILKEILKTLNERERLIVKTIMRESKKRKVTQGILQKITGIPKSSFSRILSTLARKGIIEKKGKGRLNEVKLKM